MARSRNVRLTALIFSNLLLPVAVLVFATGFFPYKPFLPGLATFMQEVGDEKDLQGLGLGVGTQPQAIFDRVVFMVVDALRSDFVYGHESGFEYTQSLIRSRAAIPFTAHATPPTVTMPRVKALTTGSVPSFLDLILNFAESDTSSSLATQDTWLAQLKAKGGKLVFYGDDTWLKLFPGDFFARHDGTSSFFVSDFTEVDHNVTRHVPGELRRDDWSAMVMHYLGLDHIGHKTGLQGPNMLPKQREMDGIVKVMYEAMEKEKHHQNTLLVLAGDHGMNAGGNHGGSGPGETEPALLFASPKFKAREQAARYKCPTAPKAGTEFNYYNKVEQSDVVPTLAGLMGMPISRNSLGVFIPELLGLWSHQDTVRLLSQNAKQVLEIVEATFGRKEFADVVASIRQELESAEAGSEACEGSSEGLQAVACRWARASSGLQRGENAEAEKLLLNFLYTAQETLSFTASSYDVPRMVLGMLLAGSACALAVASFASLWPPTSASVLLASLCVLYGMMMFASSYVEEEQHFWYWTTPVWLLLLAVLKAKDSLKRTGQVRPLVAIISLQILLAHRLSTRWNQTGQKHTGEPDIVHTFPEHHVLMWGLVLMTYAYTGMQLAKSTFANIFGREVAWIAAAVIAVPTIVFKLNFTQADAPELVRGLASQVREWTASFDLVLQARLVFVLLALATVMAVVLSVGMARTSVTAGMTDEGLSGKLPDRLHSLLTLFLMTQTRTPNIPLFLLLELQRDSVRLLLPLHTSKDSTGSHDAQKDDSALAVAVSSLLLSQAAYFCFGGSNSISSIDLSNAYNGVADYNVGAVGVLLFAGNWAGPIWWCSAAVTLLIPRKPARSSLQRQSASEANRGGRAWIEAERESLRAESEISIKPRKADEGRSEGVWLLYVAAMTVFVSSSLLAVMAACTTLRTHLFIWTVFSPKYLYAMAWGVGWHLAVNVWMGNLLWWLGSVA